MLSCRLGVLSFLPMRLIEPQLSELPLSLGVPMLGELWLLMLSVLLPSPKKPLESSSASSGVLGTSPFLGNSKELFLPKERNWLVLPLRVSFCMNDSLPMEPVWSDVACEMLRSRDSRGEASEASAVEMSDGVSRDGRGYSSCGEVGWLPSAECSNATCLSLSLPFDFSTLVFSFFSAFSALLASFSAAFFALSSSDFLPRPNMVKVAAAGLSTVGGVPGMGGMSLGGGMWDAED